MADQVAVALVAVGLAAAARSLAFQVVVAALVVALEGLQDCKHRPRLEHEAALQDP